MAGRNHRPGPPRGERPTPPRGTAGRFLAKPAAPIHEAVIGGASLEVRDLLGIAAPQWQTVTDAFHQEYYAAAARGDSWKATRFLGREVHKCPLDLWTYQELIWWLQPAIIIETGTLYGGSALWFATCMDAYGYGAVITIDRERHPVPGHPRIKYLRGDTGDPRTHGKVECAVWEARAETAGHVLVSLDGDHTERGVRRELDAFAAYVTPGSYLVVEDTNLHGHPIHAPAPHDGPGPREALDAWLTAHPEFEPDPACERHLLTFNPGGWLQRKM